VSLVVLPDGSFEVEHGDGTIEPADLLATVAMPPPFRAEAVRRSGSTWAVGARAIAVVELSPFLSGDELEVVFDGVERRVRIDGEPSFASVPELEGLAAPRFETWVARAHRIRGEMWEAELEPL
jgi:hypothetical protein